MSATGEVARQLVASGAAYHDNRPAEELEEARRRAQSEGLHPGHYIRRPEQPGEEGAIRLSIPQEDAVSFDDLVRGTVSFEPRDLDDFVILRSDGTPTYHLASTVDDVDYQITHVARGEDLLPSTPKHILLTRALGAEEATYAHLPLLFGTDGKKLSKRFAATSLSVYRDEGYLPDAVFNYLSLLGWSLDAETTIFSREQAVGAFELGDVSKNPAVFDPEKLAWMNGEYIRSLAPDAFLELSRPYVEAASGRALEPEELLRYEALAPLVQERTKLLPEAGDQVRFLFDDVDYDPGSWERVMAKEGVAEVLGSAVDRLESVDPWETVSIESSLRSMLEDLGLGAAKGLQPIRVAITGSSVSPPLFESLSVLGKEISLDRLGRALERLSS